MKEKETFKAILVEPRKRPAVIEVGNTVGDIMGILNEPLKSIDNNGLNLFPDEDVYRFAFAEKIHSYQNDEVSMVYLDKDKQENPVLNRSIYKEPVEVEMTYGELVQLFRENEKEHKAHLTGYVVFTEDSFDKYYPLESRTYVFSSNNKAFQPNMGGYSIYGSAIDGTDSCVRLERYISFERGDWNIERCYMIEQPEVKKEDIIAGKVLIYYNPDNGTTGMDLPQKLIDKYMEIYKYPEKFKEKDGKLIVEKIMPNKQKDR